MFQKLLHGFIFGLGFSVAVLIVTGFTYNFITPDDSYESSRVWLEGPSVLGVAINNTKLVQGVSETEVIVSGLIQNSSNANYESVSLEVELFDQTPIFVAECDYIVQSGVAANSENYFSTSCKVPSTFEPSRGSSNVKVVRGVQLVDM
ncbi:hypothetical protein SAMN03080615_01238 [Amphritea atlantica]|uniref:Uncharacterized protein n=1 Tax=Amphritea atlantica TaxID=355243 RepID=A0A1H9FFQ3_9GAMM|nr:hypothetical protein [Amphritea atlantica]SEQ36766.1 hypothetical protein SAMN03080615_01238 [Amphritea atlantica]